MQRHFQFLVTGVETKRRERGKDGGEIEEINRGERVRGEESRG
jgi:hypothetical protein